MNTLVRFFIDKDDRVAYQYESKSPNIPNVGDIVNLYDSLTNYAVVWREFAFYTHKDEKKCLVDVFLSTHNNKVSDFNEYIDRIYGEV